MTEDEHEIKIESAQNPHSWAQAIECGEIVATSNNVALVATRGGEKVKRIDRRTKEYKNRVKEGFPKLRPMKKKQPNGVHNPRCRTQAYEGEKCSIVLQLKSDMAEWLTKTAKSKGLKRDAFVDQICRDYKNRLAQMEARFRTPL